MFKELPERINIVNPLISLLDEDTRQKAEEMIFDNHQRRIRENYLYIDKNNFGVEDGYYTLHDEIPCLLRDNCNNPDVINLIADMLSEE